MKQKKRSILIMMLTLCLLLAVGCSNTKTSVFEQLSSYITQVDEIEYPAQGIIALGEVTHGNKEFTELKLEVFQHLVKGQNVRAFAIEGDFGGCQKVNTFIQGGEGSVNEAAAAIGFAIYRTNEMTELLEWMKDFNKDREPADQIRFYGYDMQRYDNNKEGLFAIIKDSVPSLHEEYELLLKDLDDDTMYDLDKDTAKHIEDELALLQIKLEEHKETFIASGSEIEYELAEQYAKALLENTKLRTALNYGTLRDGYMAERVKWIYEFEADHYDSKQIFITGHNAHIGKTNATFGVERAMGEILAQWYPTDYYTIGTEFNNSTFLAPDADSGERKAFTVHNTGDDRLAVLLTNASMDRLFLNVREAKLDQNLLAYFDEKQAMSSIGEIFADSYAESESRYTQSIDVSKTYDGIIFYDTVSPSVMLDD